MSFQIVCKRVAAAVFAALTLLSVAAVAQRRPLAVIVPAERTMRVAERNNVYCAGYVQSSPIDTSRKIVGGVEEQEQFFYSENNVVYLNAGSNKGVNDGDVLTVLRPRGQVRTLWTRKGDLGANVQEV